MLPPPYPSLPSEEKLTSSVQSEGEWQEAGPLGMDVGSSLSWKQLELCFLKAEITATSVFYFSEFILWVEIFENLN